MATTQDFRFLVVYNDEKDAETVKKSLLNLDDSLSVNTLPFKQGLSLGVDFTHLIVIGLKDVDGYIDVLGQAVGVSSSVGRITLILEEEHMARAKLLYLEGANYILTLPLIDKAFDAVFLRDLVHTKENNRLKSDLQRATQTAFDAMTSSSEVGQILAFVEVALTCRNYGEIADKLFELGAQLGLDFLLSIKIGGQEHHYAHSDDICKTLFQMIDESRDVSRLYSKDEVSIYHHQHASIMIKNMPVSDEHRCGVVRDLLAQLANTIESCVKSITLEQMLRKQSHSALQTVKYIRDISEENKANLSRVLDSLLADMKRSIGTVSDHNKAENAHLDTVIQSCIQEMEQMHVNSMDLEKKFLSTLAGFKNAFQLMNGGDQIQ